MDGEKDKLAMQQNLKALFDMRNYYLDALDSLYSEKQKMMNSYDERIGVVKDKLSTITGEIQDTLDELHNVTESESGESHGVSESGEPQM